MRPHRTTAKFAAGTAAAVLAAGALTTTTAGPASAASCADVDVSYATGTRFDGSSSNTGPEPIYDALVPALNARAAGKTVSYYRVNYPASMLPGSASVGNLDMVNHIKAQAAACPDQTFVLVGHSQGALVVANSIGVGSDDTITGGPTVAVIPSGIEPKVKAVVLFGNPIRGYPAYRQVTGTYQARTLDDCATGDIVCGSSGDDWNAHLSYSQPEHIEPAVEFINARL